MTNEIMLGFMEKKLALEASGYLHARLHLSHRAVQKRSAQCMPSRGCFCNISGQTHGLGFLVG